MNENADFVKLIFSVNTDNWLPPIQYDFYRELLTGFQRSPADCPYKKPEGVLDWTPED